MAPKRASPAAKGVRADKSADKGDKSAGKPAGKGAKDAPVAQEGAAAKNPELRKLGPLGSASAGTPRQPKQGETLQPTHAPH